MDNADILLLRAVEPEDADFMLECEADRDSSKWNDCRAPMSKSQLLTYALTYDADPFASRQLRLIVQKGEVSIGILDLYEISERDSRAFVGICIHPLFRKKGYGLKTLNLLRLFNEEKLGLDRIFAKVSSDNPAALALFDKAGYTRIALLPRWHKLGLKFHDFFLLQS